jgi:formylglycine-generating enzyme required for sulfatase activity
MHGNAKEWVTDAYVPDFYASLLRERRAAIDPIATASMLPGLLKANPVRITRGGSHRMPDWACRSAARRAQGGASLEDDTGFRVVMTIE